MTDNVSRRLIFRNGDLAELPIPHSRCGFHEVKFEPEPIGFGLPDRQVIQKEARLYFVERGGSQYAVIAMDADDAWLQVRDALRLTAKDVFEILLRQYADKTNDFKISIGHHELPDKTKPIGMWNLPEFCGCISLTMQEICDIHERLVEDSIGE